MSKSIEDLVTDWLEIDINPDTRKEIIDLKEAGNNEELERRLRHRIQFGTAGLRSAMEAGFSRLNDVTIMQASQGLASYVLKQTEGDKASSVVIGHDHRLNSKNFAEITATAFLLKGFKVYLLSSALDGGDLVPTPLVPFAVDYFQANCGVMITASHNPARDNGYKVYWSNGCQIIPPHDLNISQEIEMNLKPWNGAYETSRVFEEGYSQGSLVQCKEELMTAYLLHLNSEVIVQGVSDLKFIYTPMHGVGLEVFSKALRMLGVKEVLTVKEQCEPDPMFSTVKFPNPEEKGALDLSLIRADELGVELVLANDPDADRFSAAVKHNGIWRQLSGNELGFLFADYVVKNYKGSYSTLCLVNSTVSSQMVAAMAQKEGFRHVETLTGFKWIGNKAIDLEDEGFSVPFGFEEAIGFMFKGVHDKDGIAAALVFLQMAQEWSKNGQSAVDVLEEGFKKYGYFKQYNSYYTVSDPAVTTEVFERIRNSGEGVYPSTIGNYMVTYWRDLTRGVQSGTSSDANTTADGSNTVTPDLPTDPSTQMITVKLETGTVGEKLVVTMRGSGTEPKLKVYIEAQAEEELRATDLAQECWDTLKELYFKPHETGLVEA